MSKKTDVEDSLSELTAEERRATVKKMQATSPWGDLYAEAPKGAKKRIEVAYLINKFAGKHNMWPVREERIKVENKLSIVDLEYLADAWPGETGREHYRHLLIQARLRPQRTDAKFAKLVAGLSEDEKVPVRRTMDAVLDLAEPVMVTRDLVWDAICGSAEAQALLGDCFLHEHEVLRDVDIAAYWLRKAAPYNETSKNQLADLESEGLA